MNKNHIPYLNMMLYPILFEKSPVLRASATASFIREGIKGYNAEHIEGYRLAIKAFLADERLISKTVTPELNVDEVRKYLTEIGRLL
jgi:hypothetical protein